MINEGGAGEGNSSDDLKMPEVLSNSQIDNVSHKSSGIGSKRSFRG